MAKVRKFFSTERPEIVFLAAAKAGGILANNVHRWEFLYDNLVIQNNVLRTALEFETERVVFFGSSCVYPKHAPQPIKEESLLSGPLEPTNEPYAIAKIAGLKLVEAANAQHGRKWLSLMPTNLYGPGDNFDLESSHVLPAMVRKFHEAKVEQPDAGRPCVTLWGTGTARREFLYVDDLAKAACLLVELQFTGMFNVGFGTDLSIRELAATVAEIVGYSGMVAWDETKPDGTPRKLLDSTRIKSAGWAPKISLKTGIRLTYESFLQESAPRATTASGRPINL